MSNDNKQGYKRILICKLKFHGDTLLMSPVINTLIENYPDAKIDVLIYKDTYPLLSKHPLIHRFHFLERKSKGLFRSIKTFFTLKRALQEPKYDLVLNLSEQWPLAFLIGSLKTESVAFKRSDHKQKKWGKFFTHCVECQGEHIIDQQLSILSPLNIDNRKIKKNLSLYYDEVDENNVFKKYPDLVYKSYVVIQPTARQLFKFWDNDKFANLIDYLKQNNFEVILTCGYSEFDKQTVHEIYRLCKQKPNITFAGNTSFLELAVLIDYAMLYIGLDSAPMHMAAALNKPIVCLFGATNHRVWRPYSMNKNIVLWAGDYEQMPSRDKLDRQKKYLSCIPTEDVILSVKQVFSLNLNQNFIHNNGCI